MDVLKHTHSHTQSLNHTLTHTHNVVHKRAHYTQQMAGIAGAYVLNDRERFRGFFRTLPSFEFVGPSLAAIARQFGWTQMAIITQKESLFTLVSPQFP